MSHIYHLHCESCAATSECGHNHGLDALCEVLTVWPAMQELQARMKRLEIADVRTDRYEQIDLDFLREHWTHRLIVRDEYEYLYDPQTRERITGGGNVSRV